MDWTNEEDLFCCRSVFEEYCRIRNATDIGEFLNRILQHEDIIKHDKSSVRMRLQNIKSLLIEYHVENTLPLKPLDNVASMTRKIFIEELNNKK